MFYLLSNDINLITIYWLPISYSDICGRAVAITVSCDGNGIIFSLTFPVLYVIIYMKENFSSHVIAFLGSVTNTEYD